MKKSLLAAAALLAATGAVAQSSVNMYGVVDTGYLFEKKSSATYGADGSLKKKEDTKTAGFNSGYLFGPRVGFKGEEALGNGLSATYNLEMGFNSTTGAFNGGGSFGRRSVVGLKGEFGHATLGWNNTPLDNFAMDIDGNTRGDVSVTDKYTGLHYEVTFSGLRIHAMVGGDSSKTKEGNAETKKKTSSGYGLGLRYTMDNFMIGGAVQQFKAKEKDVAATKDTSSTRTEWGLAASYDFGVARLRSHYVVTENKVNGSNAKSKWEHYNVGVSVPMGAATLYAEYGRNRASAVNDGLMLKGYAADAASFGNDYRVKGSGNNFVIGADYELSKRTMIYARARRIADLKANVSNATSGAHLGKIKGYSNQFAVGLKHTF
ncbi:MAG: porin [Brachymonas sp.]|nr:porin [Brachymonas sp.]MBP7744387.1 porin [Brachymonas sp.]MBP8596110.1 porin [Brachymonas sp.]